LQQKNTRGVFFLRLLLQQSDYGTFSENARRAHAPLQPLLLFFFLNFMLIGVYV